MSIGILLSVYIPRLNLLIPYRISVEPEKNVGYCRLYLYGIMIRSYAMVLLFRMIIDRKFY
jgi:hypothetical protein